MYWVNLKKLPAWIDAIKGEDLTKELVHRMGIGYFEYNLQGILEQMLRK